MRDRRFGVEIECGYNGNVGFGGCDCRCTCEDFDTFCYCYDDCYCGEGSDGGCEVAENLLHDNGFSSWTYGIHADGSGVEIPSPILSGTAGLRELEKVMKLLRDNNFYVTSSDGLHVHHDAPDFAEDKALTARLVELWEENLPVIDNFVHPMRRGGAYWACQSAKYTHGRSRTRYDHVAMTYVEGSETRWDEFKRTKDVDSLGGRTSLNVDALHEHGSIEFRLFEGTLDFEQAYAWIHFGQSFLEFAKQRKTLRVCSDAMSLLEATRLSTKSRRILMNKANPIQVAA